MKKCSVCGKEKELEEFHKDNSRPDKRKSGCKDCYYKPREKIKCDKDSKLCGKCNLEKNFSEFYKNKSSKDGHCYKCKSCSYIKKLCRKSNRVYTNLWIDDKKLCSICKEYKDQSMYYKIYGKCDSRCIECNKNRKKKIEEKNRQKFLALPEDEQAKIRLKKSEYSKYHNRKNKEKYRERRKRYYASPEYKRRKKEINDFRMKHDENYRIKKTLRSNMRNTLKNYRKSGSSLKLLGCSIEEFKIHIEKQFTDGMNWDNYGFYGWHYEHIRPCCSFDLTDLEQQKQCFHYTNYQPMWCWDNWSKNGKWDG